MGTNGGEEISFPLNQSFRIFLTTQVYAMLLLLKKCSSLCSFQVLLGTDPSCALLEYLDSCYWIGNKDTEFVLGIGKLFHRVSMDASPGTRIFEEAGCDTPASPSCGACF
ncbi:hypothetical protein ACH5RR_032842 [Cinchona calisaya]|uniref:Uncharacterized protein n=1 Tax=Cinchona calisaya TaxID=153742 RepID=A0ABD2YNE2_9GENT